MERKFSEIGPEAKAYKTWLAESSRNEKPLPPIEERQSTKKALRAVRERRLARENGESRESAEAKAGKERLREIVERGDLPLVFLEKIAIYLDCELYRMDIY